jgi:hypothetical protein
MSGRAQAAPVFFCGGGIALPWPLRGFVITRGRVETDIAKKMRIEIAQVAARAGAAMPQQKSREQRDERTDDFEWRIGAGMLCHAGHSARRRRAIVTASAELSGLEKR